jgi:serine/threonine protein kinase/Flp pilus assembly protein TadD
MIEMPADASLESGELLELYIAAYESALARDGQADLGRFLPEATHPLYHDILLELVRVDLEAAWTRGQEQRLDAYRQRFPQLFEDSANLAALTFEEYRLRLQAGENPTPEEYRQLYGIDPHAWPAPARAALDDSRMCPTIKAPEAQAADAVHAAVLHELRQYDPASAHVLERALDQMPAVGERFLSFQLFAELGRGSFGRVFLARQGELADRPVALKIAADIRGEARTLAQLQHTNIVPIYSIHHAGALHAVCMPFLGSITLAHVLRGLRAHGGVPATGRALVATVGRCKTTLGEQVTPASSSPSPGSGEAPPWGDGLPASPLASLGAGEGGPGATAEPAGYLKELQGRSYVEAILWLGARLADGLAHAHERGILHHDLKPANVLLTDDGQPLLLDFNLSEDTKIHGQAAAALVGGTLPYMAPEHLEAFRRGERGSDARSDIYALGVILFELLAGRPPFPHQRGPLAELLPRLIRDRDTVPALPDWNPVVSPAAAAIVHHCLEADPARRYQTARQLREDLERHLQSKPLRHQREPSLRERGRKWIRRHPRLAPCIFAAVVTALLLGVSGLYLARADRLARLEAAAAYDAFRGDVREARVQFLDGPTADRARLVEIAASCRAALERYQVLDDAAWHERQAITRLEPAEQTRVREEVGELLYLLAALAVMQVDPEAAPARRAELLRPAVELNTRARECYAEGKAPRALAIQRALLLDEAVDAVKAPLQGPRDLCMVACQALQQGRPHQALPLLQRASAQDRQDYWTWYLLGVCQDWLGQSAQAAASYSACIALQPGYRGWYIRRGLALSRQNEPQLACADFDEALRLRPGDRDTLTNRALGRLVLGKLADAEHDLTRVLASGPALARVHLMRAWARALAGNKAGQQQDEAAAEQLPPTDEISWIARGAKRAPHEALADYEQALKLNPRSLAAREAKAHMLSKLGRTEDAVRVLDTALALFPEHAPARAARGTLLAHLGRRDDALRDATVARQLDQSPTLTYQLAGIYALSARQHDADRTQALALLTEALRRGYGHDLLDTDRDLDALRNDAPFLALRDAMRSLYPQTRARPPTPLVVTGAAP